MGLRGPLKVRPPRRGGTAAPRLSSAVLTDARNVYTRLRALGDQYLRVAEAKAKKAKYAGRIPAELETGMRVWREALHVAYRIASGGQHAPPEAKDPLADHLGRRPVAPRS